MASVRCASCGRRKGRRACPALGASICATCCGTKRGVTIRCPAGCVYLSSAAQHPAAVVQRRRDQYRQALAAAAEGLSDIQMQLYLLAHALVAAAVAGPEFEAVSDRDVADAVAALAATRETASHGLIYEHHATAPAAERLRGELTTAFAAVERQGWRVRDADVAAALRRVERAAMSCRDTFGDERAYVTIVTELFPPRPRATAGLEPAPGNAPRLIVP